MVSVLETGHIYFFYTPRVQREEARSIDELQRFFLVLRPRQRQRWRLLRVGRKRMPRIREAGGGEKLWATVEQVGTEIHDLEGLLQRQIYETKTRGERVQPEARPAGAGVYALVRHDDHTHLTYELELPKERGEVQVDLNIEERASYVVAVPNREPGRRFIDLTVDLLDAEGTDVILMGATKEPEEELGAPLDRESERQTEASIFRDLDLERHQLPLEPLFRGEWR